MLPTTDSFEFDLNGSDILYGRNRIDELGEYLATAGLKRAMIVCGSNVGSNADLMDPIRDSIDEQLVDVFDETTPEKSARTIFAGIDVMRDRNPDVLIGVGGGSSLDVARQMSVFDTSNRSRSDFQRDARAGTVTPPQPEDPTDVIVIPTTFAGADLSDGGSFPILTAEESPSNQPIITKGRVMPRAMIYDPTAFETTPMSALAGSAMNGFNKGIETLYARHPTPISDATSMHGLSQLRGGYPTLGSSPQSMDMAVTGIILVQIFRTISVIHAFAHGFARRYPVQQGEIHAILAPHVLEYLFETIDARRSMIAASLDIDTKQSDAEIATSIVEEVTRLRDSFTLPTRLRSLEPIDQGDFPAIAKFILDDHLMPNAPGEFSPTQAEIEDVLQKAW